MTNTSLVRMAAVLMVLPATVLAQEAALENGTFVMVPDTPANEYRTYSFQVPLEMSSLLVMTTGGTGDSALYANRGEPWFGGSDPDAFADCHQVFLSTDQGCDYPSPPSGSWYFQVHGGTTGFANVELGAVAARFMSNNSPREIFGAAGSETWYYLQVPAGQGLLSVTTSGGSGDPNMVVRDHLFGTGVCSSENPGSTDACAVESPAPGRWLIRITGAEAYAGVALTAAYTPAEPAGEGPPAGGDSAPSDQGAFPLATLGGLGFLAFARRRPRG